MTGLDQNDFDWMRGILAGRSPEERERMKAVVERMCEEMDGPALPAPRPDLPDDAQAALLRLSDDIAEARTILYALEMAFGDLPDPDRAALCTVAEILTGRLAGIRASVESVRTGVAVAA